METKWQDMTRMQIDSFVSLLLGNIEKLKMVKRIKGFEMITVKAIEYLVRCTRFRSDT